MTYMPATAAQTKMLTLQSKISMTMLISWIYVAKKTSLFCWQQTRNMLPKMFIPKVSDEPGIKLQSSFSKRKKKESNPIFTVKSILDPLNCLEVFVQLEKGFNLSAFPVLSGWLLQHKWAHNHTTINLHSNECRRDYYMQFVLMPSCLGQ